MGVNYTDTFGPMLFKAVEKLGKNLEKASAKNAYYIQASWISGIRTQSLKSNPVQNWAPLSEKYLKSAKKRAGSNLINILSPDGFSASIELAQDSNRYYHVGTNTNSGGFYYPVAIETGTKKMPARPTLEPVLILTSDTVLENYKDFIKEAIS